MCHQAKPADMQKENDETKKEHKRANRGRIAYKRAYKQRKHTNGENKHVIK